MPETLAAYMKYLEMLVVTAEAGIAWAKYGQKMLQPATVRTASGATAWVAS